MQAFAIATNTIVAIAAIVAVDSRRTCPPRILLQWLSGSPARLQVSSQPRKTASVRQRAISAQPNCGSEAFDRGIPNNTSAATETNVKSVTVVGIVSVTTSIATATTIQASIAIATVPIVAIALVGAIKFTARTRRPPCPSRLPVCQHACRLTAAIQRTLNPKAV